MYVCIVYTIIIRYNSYCCILIGLKSTSYLVEKLAKELEQEQEELSKRLQKQKEEATLKLKQVSSFVTYHAHRCSHLIPTYICIDSVIWTMRS